MLWCACCCRGICSCVCALGSSKNLEGFLWLSPISPVGCQACLSLLRMDGLTEHVPTEMLPVSHPGGGAEFPRSRLSPNYTFLALKPSRCFGNTSPFLIMSLSG